VIYEGNNPSNFENNMAYGQGVTTFPFGAEYVGEHRSDMFHGRGTHTFPDGTELTGRWTDSELIGN